MLLCPRCTAHQSDDAKRCGACGASLTTTTAAEQQDLRVAKRNRTRHRGNMFTGFLLCFALPTLMGLPISLLPAELLQNGIFACIFGIPLGYLVSRFGTGVLSGACIGCAVGIALAMAFAALHGGEVTLATVLVGIATGVLPGAIMGLHIAHDR